jgi:quinol-cytochrome oxidoreductase complex cytochrome b subunit
MVQTVLLVSGWMMFHFTLIIFLKDLFCIHLLLFFGVFVFSSKFIKSLIYSADPMETPKHLVPEWYLFYHIMQFYDQFLKAAGIVAMVGAPSNSF